MLTSTRFSICLLGALCGSFAWGGERSSPSQVRDLLIPDSGLVGSELDRRYLLSPDGKLLLFGYRYDAQVQIWDVADAKKLGVIQGGFRGNGWSAAFSADSKTLATTDLDHFGASTVDLWDLGTFKKQRNLDDDVNILPFACLALTPDGKALALGVGPNPRSRSADLGVHLWNAASGLESRQLTVGLGGEDPLAARRTLLAAVEAVAFTPDGKALAVVSQNKIHLLEMLTGKERGLLGTFPTLYQRPNMVTTSAVRQASFSPDGRLFALLTTDGALRLWDVAFARPLRPLQLDAEKLGTPQTFHFDANSQSLHAFTAAGKLVTWNISRADDAPSVAANLPESELQRLWENLGDVERRHKVTGAIETLSAHSHQALSFLEARLQPAPTIEPRYLDRLIRDLQQSDFNARKRAAAELRLCGEQAIPALLQSQEARFDDLTRKMLDKLAAQFPTAEQLRQAHALQVLEAVNTPAARTLLEKLAEGAPAALLTREARKILERLPAAKSSSGASSSCEKRCADLGSSDATLAFDAMLDLARQPQEAVAQLRIRLAPLAQAAPNDSPEHVQTLLAQLDAPDFATREKALAQLAKLGPAAEPAVRRALADNPSLEQQNRLDRLLRQFNTPNPAPAVLELERGIELLERLASPDSRRLLTELRDASKNRSLKSALDAALARLGK